MTGEPHLHHLLSRRSVRDFKPDPIPKALLERLILAATSAPSPTNRQPWRYTIVQDIAKRARLAEAVKERADEIKEIIRRGHHAEDFGNYSDFFHEPLERAAAIIIPQYRIYPDLIANLIASGGGDPEAYTTAHTMQAELCATSASCMALLLQAHAEGLAACWMSGPMIARERIAAELDIREPWKMIGAIALGYPVKGEPSKSRKVLTDVIRWL
jgi:coenzyme F420-0:L-glutamate ligase/coenzyme F420-1:gamma-L-glutamate ligase